MRQVKDLVRETGQCAFRQTDDFDWHVDIDHGYGAVDDIFDVLQVVADVPAFGDPGDRGREADGHVGGKRLAYFLGHLSNAPFWR